MADVGALGIADLIRSSRCAEPQIFSKFSVGNRSGLEERGFLPVES